MPMKVKDLVDLLEADGWFLVRTKGSHRVIGSFTTLQNRVPSPGRVRRAWTFRQERLTALCGKPA